jgi:hypothetical protein
MILEDGNETQYPRALVYAAGGAAPLATIDLPHLHLGRYEADWTPSTAGVFSVVFVTYADSGHTVENVTYTRAVDQVFVTQSDMDDLAAQIVRILGLVHENVFIDNTVHDAFGSLVAGRIRIFDSKANVELATDGGSETTGLVATYEIETSYEAQCRMGSYRVKKVS